jgi:hypothetical protein
MFKITIFFLISQLSQTFSYLLGVITFSSYELPVIVNIYYELTHLPKESIELPFTYQNPTSVSQIREKTKIP